MAVCPLEKDKYLYRMENGTLPMGRVLHPLCVWSGVNKQGVTQGAVHQKLTCLDIAAWLSEGQSHSSVTICAS